MIDRELAGKPHIGHVGIGAADTVLATIGAEQDGRVDHGAGVVNVAAGQIDDRAGSTDHLVRGQINGAAIDQELTNRIPHQVGVAREIGQRRADPGLAGFLIDSACAHIDGDRLAIEPAVLLQRRIRQFVAAKLDGQQVARRRQLGIRDPRDIEDCGILEQDPAGARNRRYARTRIAQDRHGGGHRLPRSIDQRPSLEVDRLPDDLDQAEPSGRQWRGIETGAGRALERRQRGGVARNRGAAVGEDRRDCLGPERDRAGVERGVERIGWTHAAGIDADLILAVEHDRAGSRGARGRDGGAVLLDRAADQRDVALRGIDQAVVDEGAHRRDVIAARVVQFAVAGKAQVGGRIVVGALRDVSERTEAARVIVVGHAHAGDQRDLTAWRGDGAAVGDIRRRQQGKPLRAHVDGGARRHGDAAGAGRVARQQNRIRLKVRRIEIADATVEEAVVAGGEIVAEQVERRGDQGTDIDLAGSAENDAVAVDQIDRAFGLDLSEDLARHAGRIEHPVEHDPVVARAGIAGRLVEIDLGVPADVEA